MYNTFEEVFGVSNDEILSWFILLVGEEDEELSSLSDELYKYCNPSSKTIHWKYVLPCWIIGIYIRRTKL